MLHTTATHSTSPLSPNTKATLEKHGIAKTTGLLAGVATSISTRQKRDVGCVTGTNFVVAVLVRYSYLTLFT